MAARGINGRLDVARRGVHVAAQVKLDRDAGGPESGSRRSSRVTPAMRPNMRSSGVATEEAMVSGLAPGRDALT